MSSYYPKSSLPGISQKNTVFLFQKKPLAFSLMAKPVGPLCNLDCTYCYYLEKEKLYPESTKWLMNDNVLEQYIRQTIDAHDVPVVSFAWHGGEPTLAGLDYFRKAVSLQEKYSGTKKIQNVLQTNGLLLDDEWCSFFATHQFLLGISIDGPEELHDRFRMDKGGKPTFRKVMQAIELLKKHRVEFNTLTVLNRHNAAYPLEIYRFLKEAGSAFMQFIPIVERVHPSRKGLAHVDEQADDAAVSAWSVTPQQFGKFLCAVFDEWIKKDVGKYFVQLFDATLANWMGEDPGLCLFKEKCGDAPAMEHNGDLYSCDHFVYPEYRIGKIGHQDLRSIMTSEKQQKFGNDKKDKLPKYCRNCKFLFACRGECPKNRFTKTEDGEPGLNYLCEGYKMFFAHVTPYMEKMKYELSK